VSEEEGYGLVMPFVTVTSKGGPHDDAAYVAGWEMGALDARLQYERPALLEQTIQSVNTEQADLVAMKHGYEVTIRQTDNEWAWLIVARRDA
jgi:hypothetical protein